MALDFDGLDRVCDLAQTDSYDRAWDIEREVMNAVAFEDIRASAENDLPFMREFRAFLFDREIRDRMTEQILRLEARRRAARRAEEYERRLLKRIGLEPEP